jgi:hypothetical protein
MRPAVILIYIAFWIAPALAFFPWIPDYRCEEDGDCKSEKKRQLEESAGIAERTTTQLKPVSFEITQRWSGVSSNLAFIL